MFVVVVGVRGRARGARKHGMGPLGRGHIRSARAGVISGSTTKHAQLCVAGGGTHSRQPDRETCRLDGQTGLSPEAGEQCIKQGLAGAVACRNLGLLTARKWRLAGGGTGAPAPQAVNRGPRFLRGGRVGSATRVGGRRGRLPGTAGAFVCVRLCGTTTCRPARQHCSRLTAALSEQAEAIRVNSQRRKRHARGQYQPRGAAMGTPAQPANLFGITFHHSNYTPIRAVCRRVSRKNFMRVYSVAATVSTGRRWRPWGVASMTRSLPSMPAGTTEMRVRPQGTPRSSGVFSRCQWPKSR